MILSKVFILTRLLPTNVCKYQDKAKGNDSYFAEEFQTNMIKIPRIIFSPGATLRKARKDANFERKEEIVTKNDGGGNGGGDRPEIE